jgi:hypothetical protein
MGGYFIGGGRRGSNRFDITRTHRHKPPGREEENNGIHNPNPSEERAQAMNGNEAEAAQGRREG